MTSTSLFNEERFVLFDHVTHITNTHIFPCPRVDHLYAFFVQWTPEIYGDEEEITPERRGFVVIEDGEEFDDTEMLDDHFGPESSFQKDWEVKGFGFVVENIESFKGITQW